MKNEVTLIVSSLLVASMAYAPNGYAQPRPPPPIERPVRPLPPGERPLPPAPERPLPPGVVAPPVPYSVRLQKIYEERRLQRAELRRDARAWEAGRAARELEHRRELESVWGRALLTRPECRAELELHADRMARLNRIIDLAEDQHDPTLLAHARVVLDREIARDARVMGDIRMRLGLQ
jgi:hypothetical protein